MEQYVKAILHRLQCSKKKKKEIEKELKSDIQIAMSEGEALEDICKRMGTPEEIAEAFNENLSEQERQDAKKKNIVFFAVTGVALVCIVAVIFFCVWNQKDNTDKAKENDISIVSSKSDKEDDEAKEQSITPFADYDKEAVIEKTKKVIDLLNAEDYDTLKTQYADDIMKPTFEKENMDEVKKSISEHWGMLKSYGNFYNSGVKQDGKKYIVVQVNAAYEYITVTYTITFDEQGRLAGLYMK